MDLSPTSPDTSVHTFRPIVKTKDLSFLLVTEVLVCPDLRRLKIQQLDYCLWRSKTQRKPRTRKKYSGVHLDMVGSVPDLLNFVDLYPSTFMYFFTRTLVLTLVFVRKGRGRRVRWWLIIRSVHGIGIFCYPRSRNILFPRVSILMVIEVRWVTRSSSEH